MSHFFIKSDQLLNFTLSLQKINDIALPIAVQNSLNSVVRDIKKRTLKKTTEKQFKIKKRTFFQANSAFKTHNAKEYNYNINKIKAEAGITKGERANEKATEQVGSQQTATPIKRSINPLGDKPQTKAIIDVLSKKPEIYDASSGWNPAEYYNRVARAKKRNAPFLYKKNGRGSVGRVRKFDRIKSGKKKGRLRIDIQPIASYIKSGFVKLNKKKPFLNDAAKSSMSTILEKQFVKEAEKQIERAIKRR
jgi:hypothetical protein